MALDEQEQINMLRAEVSAIGMNVDKLTMMLIGDKVKDPSSRALVDDLIENTVFRKSINKKFNYLVTAFVGGSIALLTKQFWLKLLGVGG